MNGSIFQIFPNLSQNWLKFNKIYEKLGDFAQYCQIGRLVYEWVTFLEKLVFVWVYFQITLQHIPTKTNLSTPRVEHPQNLSISKFDGQTP